MRPSAIDLSPQAHDSHVTLGLAFTQLKNYQKAEQSYREAHSLEPANVQTMINLASLLTELGNVEGALAFQRKAIALMPGNVDARIGLAASLQRTQDIVGSIVACQHALELAPGRADLWRLRATNLAAAGRFDESAASLHRSLELEPDSIEALRFLARIGKLDHEPGTATRLREAFVDGSRTAREQIAAGFALGNLLDQNGDFDGAFKAFQAANFAMRVEHAAHGLTFNSTQFDRHVAYLIRNYSRDAFAVTRQWGDPSELPVFIVGMPRSGTSLVEQIIATHPKVHGKGESKDLPALRVALEAGQAANSPCSWDPTAVKQLAENHLRTLGLHGLDIKLVVDKLPDNILLLGHIAILFPQARVIICHRNLADVCLSNFFQYFDGGMPWSYDMKDCINRAQAIERLATHWSAVLPLRVLDLHYEALVADQEGESRRLIDFLGLDWNPVCLGFHKTERIVLTASQWQVRQPLYASSVGRWRCYRTYLEPLLKNAGV